MGSKRLTRVNELLRREIADALYRVMPDGSIDMATVTVTRVSTSPNLRNARVMVSVRGDEPLQRNTVSSLYRRRKEIQEMINRDMTLKYTPRLSFQLDHSVAEGDHVLHLLHDLEAEHPEWTAEDESASPETHGPA